MKIKPLLIRNSGTVFNLIFGLYIYFISPHVVFLTNQVMHQNQKILTFGIFLLLLIAADLLGVIYKVPAIGMRATKKEEDRISGIMMFLWIGRLCVTCMLGMMALIATGLFDLINEESENIIGIIFIITLVIKEIFVLIYFIEYIPFKGKKYKPNFKKEVIGDVLQLIYVCFGYSIIWQSLAATTPMADYNLGEFLINFAMAMFVFIVLIMPLRMVYVVEDLLFIKTTKQKIWWWVSFVLMILAGMEPML